ncbi:hypothetical protein [uncultured Draconibacterium sp.]|uniref:hypothetical protein n=1 Tax=uncultured Draconibacterium sp. TaxID=1573823 RepID=UPI0029C63657|nr:hypothetical protein [uncultured Draconibacterium sp.]
MEKNEIQNPILVYTNEVEVNRDLRHIQDMLIPALQQLKHEFEKLKLGLLTNEYLKDMLFDDFKLISIELKRRLSEENSSSVLKEKAYELVKQKLSNVYTKYKELKNNGVGNSIPLSHYFDYISVDEKGEIILTEEAINDIRDRNSVFASSPRAIELKKAHDEAAKALNVFYQMAKGNIGIIDLSNMFRLDKSDNLVATDQHDYEMFKYARTGKA